MTDDRQGIEGSSPPWSVETLADLHAGVLDQTTATRLWSEIEQDAEARAVLDALEATTADLHGLASDTPEPMPAQFAARLDAALAEEARAHFNAAPQPSAEPVAPVVSIDVARRRRNRAIGWGAGIVTAAAAAAAVVAVAVPGNEQTGGTPIAEAPSSASAPPMAGGSPLALRSDGMDAAIGPALGARDLGQLGSQDNLNRCLQQAGVNPSNQPAGVRPVTIDGQPGTLVMLTTGTAAQYRALTFGSDCRVLTDKIIGRK